MRQGFELIDSDPPRIRTLFATVHTRLAVMQVLKDRSKLQPNGCIEWQGGKNTSGYGQFHLFGHTHRAHRISCMLANNTVLPPELMACHKCDNPKCINPDHLFIGTGKDNNADMMRKGRVNCEAIVNISKNNHPCIKITFESMLELRNLRAQGAEIKDLIAKYGICRGTVFEILSGKKRAAKLNNMKEVTNG